MIRVQNLTPEVYYNESRDFQLIGRIYEIVFNYLKNNINEISYVEDAESINETLVDLVITTLGFKKLHNYDIDQLRGLYSIFQTIIRHKGSLKAVKEVILMLLNVVHEKIDSTLDNLDTKLNDIINYDEDEKLLTIIVPPSVTNITLLYDVLDYILPAGISVDIIKTKLIISEVETQTGTSMAEYHIVKTAKETSYIIGYDNNVEVADLGAGRNDNMVVPPYIKNEEASNE